MKIKFLTLFLFILSSSIFSQNKQYKYEITHEDSLALENIIVEKYYISDSTDYNDTIKNSLPKGAVTFRIFIDMKPDYTCGYPNGRIICWVVERDIP